MRILIPGKARCVFAGVKPLCRTAIPSTSLGTGLAVVARASSPCPAAPLPIQTVGWASAHQSSEIGDTVWYIGHFPGQELFRLSIWC